MEAAETGGGAVGAGDFLVAGHDDDGLGPQAFQVAGHLAQDVGVAAGERHVDHFDGAVGVAAAEQDFQLAADAERGVGIAHGGGTAEQADAQGARGGILRHHGRRRRVGRPRRREAVREKHVVDPGRLAIDLSGAQETVGPFGQERGGGQLDENQGGQQEAGGQGQPAEPAEHQRRGGEEIPMVRQ